MTGSFFEYIICARFVNVFYILFTRLCKAAVRRVIAIVDPDVEYAGRLAQYFNNHENGGMKAVIFSDTKKFLSKNSDYDVRILLIDETEYCGLHEGDAGGVVICLSGDGFSSVAVSSVNKYSRADLLLKNVLREYEDKAPSYLEHASAKRSRMIGVYSPAGRCGKTTFSITVSQLLGQRGRCLLIVLDEFAGVFRYLAADAVGDLSDVIYAYRQGRYSWVRLSQSVCHFGSTDYIAPVRYAEDLAALSPQQMTDLLGHIKKESGYDFLILDMGSYGKHAAEITEICDEVYMPVPDDAISSYKAAEYRESLEQSGRAEMLARIKEVKLPYEERFDRALPGEEEYGYGAMYEYAGGLFPDTGESE